jgi:hypothetical protein
VTQNHELRQKYHPKQAGEPLRLIIIAESPPEPSPDLKYFYKPTGFTGELLFSALMKQIDFSPTTKEIGLREFQRRGWFLVDATYQPVNQLDDKIADQIILGDYLLLVADLNELTPDRRVPVILIKKNVCQLLESKLLKDGFNVLNKGTVIPFPFGYHRKDFHDKFRTLSRSVPR